jgi:hypothetical protein
MNNMSLKDNKDYINLKSEDRKGFKDLEVRLEGDIIFVKDSCGDLGFTVGEVEALYNFAQIVKNQ